MCRAAGAAAAAFRNNGTIDCSSGKEADPSALAHRQRRPQLPFKSKFPDDVQTRVPRKFILFLGKPKKNNFFFHILGPSLHQKRPPKVFTIGICLEHKTKRNEYLLTRELSIKAFILSFYASSFRRNYFFSRRNWV